MDLAAHGALEILVDATQAEGLTVSELLSGLSHGQINSFADLVQREVERTGRIDDVIALRDAAKD